MEITIFFNKKIRQSVIKVKYIEKIIYLVVLYDLTNPKSSFVRYENESL